MTKHENCIWKLPLVGPQSLDPSELFSHLSDGRAVTSKALSGPNGVKAL